MPTLFETINQRADAIKSARWQAYSPLTAQQLTDYDAVADEPAQPDPDPLPDWIVLITPSAAPEPPLRSTRRSAHKYRPFMVLKRPTEQMAIAHTNGGLILDDDYPPITRKRPAQKRWCIYCKDRHPIRDFVRHRRYTCGLSYACKKTLQDQKRQGWYYGDLKKRGYLTVFV